MSTSPMAAILAIHAHPDDIETLSAGTLALLSGAGHRVTIVTVTAGEGGSTDYTPEETGAIRQAEGKAAAAVIDADYWCIGIPDLSVFNDDPTRHAVTETIRRAAPDIVLGPSPVDYHPDHEAVAILVRDACFASSVPNYRTGPSAVLPAIPHLYMMDPIGGRDRDGARITPEFGADITTALDAKRRMLAQHVSQDAWVAKQHDIADHLSSMEKWSRRRGRDLGVEAGEGFRQYRHHPYPTTGLLQELLGGWLVRPTASA